MSPTDFIEKVGLPCDQIPGVIDCRSDDVAAGKFQAGYIRDDGSDTINVIKYFFCSYSPKKELISDALGQFGISENLNNLFPYDNFDKTYQLGGNVLLTVASPADGCKDLQKDGIRPQSYMVRLWDRSYEKREKDQKEMQQQQDLGIPKL